jgi:hypothetical protein
MRMPGSSSTDKMSLALTDVTGKAAVARFSGL